MFGNPDLHPQRATHYVLGADVDVTATLRVEVVGFWKDMRELVVPGEGPEDPVLANDGRGRAYGGELLRAAAAVAQPVRLDRVHAVAQRAPGSPRPALARLPVRSDEHPDALASYKLPRGFQVGARYRYVTGNPYTPVTGAYFDSNADRYVPITGRAVQRRLPAFNQLDLRVDKVWTFDRWRFSAYLDVQNVSRATNPEALSYNFDFTCPSPVAGLPLLPIVGRAGRFLMTRRGWPC